MMKTLFNKPIVKRVAALAIGLFSAASVHAAGLMSPKNDSLSTLELRQHHVNVSIEDGYATTSVEQVFYNPHGSDLEALYSFPIPEKAAVSQFTYWIDGRPVSGEVLEKEKARKIYQEEKAAGRETAITEQDSYKTFDIAVYPVRGQQEVKIKLSYIQPTHVDTSIGRYVYPLEDGGTDDEDLSFWTYNDKVTEAFSFNLRFRSSYPVDKFHLPKHPQAKVSKISDTQWHVSLSSQSTSAARGSVDGDEAGSDLEGLEATHDSAGQNSNGAVAELNTDILVYWRHQAGLPGAVDLITYREEGKDRGTFMMTLTPGDDLAPITEGRDWVFVLDYSGSMSGKYHSMIEGVKKGLARLNPEDRFRIFIFSTNAREVTREFRAANPENVKQAIKLLESHQPNGSTNLYDGLSMGTKVLDADRSSAIILVTDGVANVGVTEKTSFLSLLEKNDVRLFTFVMGNSANRPLLEGMAEISNGFAISISNSDEIGGKMMEATSKLKHQAFHDVKLRFKGIKVKNLSPQKIGSLYRGQQLIVFGHYWGDEEKLHQRATLELEGKISGQTKQYSTSFDFPKNGIMHPEIERLWAYAAIEDLQAKMNYFGSDADSEQAITDIAVEYGLVTNYTSMLVLRDEVFEQRGIKRSNKARSEKENTARSAREAAPTRDNRVDRSAPMYNNPAPSHSGGGGGSMNMFGILLLLPLVLLPGYRRKRRLLEGRVA